jgi:Uma2 family endonuclease
MRVRLVATLVVAGEGSGLAAERSLEWAVPPPDGFTVEEFLELDDLPRHTELIDGVLVFRRPQRKWHSHANTLLVRMLDEQVPPSWRADRAMAVRLGKRQMPEPDVVVVTAAAYDGTELETYYLPGEVLIAIETVSPDSKIHDRDIKPRKYAVAGIQHYWRVEQDGGKGVAYTYELDSARGEYVLTGIHHDRLQVSVPFDVDIDLTAVDRHSR